ncbi:transcription termination/antitermination protein NusG [Antarcticimicrobium sediminis]|uniref:Transcriptional activator RfaH n=1 Tax=Antarcticimicrobium sediminis TaxID=2546227 RepID=A0A4R5EHD5_9RHOB|nr:transcription termination/antitermination NusG family protein [Antarcticimicrobium sediminis]TDE33707.1 transcriptional activator RfaH [Antarcticimicrobium sediminis]
MHKGERRLEVLFMLSLRSKNLTLASWYLLLCKPNQNHIAFRNLRRQGVDLFMPRHMAERRWRGRVITEARPVFAGYIFFSTDPARPNWHKIGSTPGVAQLVGFGSGGPAEVPAEIVTGLMQRCDAEGFLQQEQDLNPGDQIRITKGPLRDFVTTVDMIDPERRIHVLLDLLGRKTKVVLEPSQVTQGL